VSLLRERRKEGKNVLRAKVKVGEEKEEIILKIKFMDQINY